MSLRERLTGRQNLPAKKTRDNGADPSDVPVRAAAVATEQSAAVTQRTTGAAIRSGMFGRRIDSPLNPGPRGDHRGGAMGDNGSRTDRASVP